MSDHARRDGSLQPSAGWILGIACLGVLIAQIDTTVVNLAVKPIGTALAADVRSLQWVIDGYNLIYACFLLTGGALGDLYGRRGVFLLGIAIFTAGSLCAGWHRTLRP